MAQTYCRPMPSNLQRISVRHAVMKTKQDIFNSSSKQAYFIEKWDEKTEKRNEMKDEEKNNWSWFKVSVKVKRINEYLFLGTNQRNDSKAVSSFGGVEPAIGLLKSCWWQYWRVHVIIKPLPGGSLVDLNVEYACMHDWLYDCRHYTICL